LNRKFHLVYLLAAALMLAACAPVAPVAQPAAPAPATEAVATEAPAAVSEAPTAEAEVPATGVAPDAPRVPTPPADGSRPLADIPPAERADAFSGPAETYVKPDTVYVATIVTDKGNIVAELYPDTPESLNNFVTLAQNGFYDGLTFHRVEPGFVIQGGDPQGDGGGGPGYTIPGEFLHTHPRGALAWARTGDEINPERRSSGSQFYITLDATPFLDGGYSVFGYVLEGMEIADQIAQGDVIQRIEIAEAEASQLPTPTPTPEPKAPASEEGRPLAALAVAERERYFNMPAESVTLEEGKTYQATVKTSKGDIVIDLDSERGATTVNNLKLLADLGFYDGMPVSYVEPDTYALFGSPASRPDSDVGYLLPLEPDAATSQIVTGTVAMYPIPDQASGELRASGSQFFISLVELPSEGTQLNVLGKISEGLDIVAQLQTGDAVESITVNEK
jgi:peptidyl-prolyl cis-trans isomerase B (cyclophilin B)